LGGLGRAALRIGQRAWISSLDVHKFTMLSFFICLPYRRPDVEYLQSEAVDVSSWRACLGRIALHVYKGSALHDCKESALSADTWSGWVGWIGLNLVGLGWIGLGWIGLGCLDLSRSLSLSRERCPTAVVMLCVCGCLKAFMFVHSLKVDGT
jgi:hypothetical protein